ncbi:hypothetical protein [Erwinia typographi]|uniref:hypothetical protein n=1 Tax=Erwinia typographi TaxID=371042 RepID=UPI0012EE27F9|nr:hypothetical protein [Erwinia typographi]
MNIRFEPEIFGKLLKRANAEDTNIPALTNKILREYFSNLSKEENNGRKEQPVRS